MLARFLPLVLKLAPYLISGVLALATWWQTERLGDARERVSELEQQKEDAIARLEEFQERVREAEAKVAALSSRQEATERAAAEVRREIRAVPEQRLSEDVKDILQSINRIARGEEE